MHSFVEHLKRWMAAHVQHKTAEVQCERSRATTGGCLLLLSAGPMSETVRQACCLKQAGRCMPPKSSANAHRASG